MIRATSFRLIVQAVSRDIIQTCLMAPADPAADRSFFLNEVQKHQQLLADLNSLPREPDEAFEPVIQKLMADVDAVLVSA